MMDGCEEQGAAVNLILQLTRLISFRREKIEKIRTKLFGYASAIWVMSYGISLLSTGLVTARDEKEEEVSIGEERSDELRIR